MISEFLLCACSPLDVLSGALGKDVVDTDNTNTKEALAEIEESNVSDSSDAESVIKIGDDDENLPVINVKNVDDAIILKNDPEEVPAYEEIYDPVNKEYSVECKDPSKVTLSFVGDVSFAEGYSNMSRLHDTGSIAGVLSEDVLKIMNETDIMMINNEFPYSDRGAPTAGKTYTFRARPESAKYLHDMGVDIVSLANNHAYDYGPDALLDTVDILNEEKVPFVGAGKNLEEACKPAYFHVNGHIVSYVSATQIERLGNPDTKEATETTPGVLRTLDSTRFVEVIKEAKANSDFVVVYVHWGSESTDLVEESQRQLARDYVAAGAGLIIGDHSHCLQGIDYVEDVPVFYSLGNFWFNSKTLDTCIVTATLDEECKISEIDFIPCVQSGCRTTLAEGDKISSILMYLQGISNYANVSLDGKVTKSDVDNNIQHGMNTSPAKKAPTPDPNDPMTALLVGADGAAADTAEPAEETTENVQ